MKQSSRIAFIASIVLNLLLGFVLLLHVYSCLRPGVSPVDANRPGWRSVFPLSGKGCDMVLRNVRFHWNDSVYITAESLRVRSVPVPPNTYMDMDNPDSFVLDVQEGRARLPLGVMEHIMKAKIFSAPGSVVKNVTVTSAAEGNKKMLKLKGNINFLFWISFDMKMSVIFHRENGLMEMRAERIKAMGLPFAGSFMKFFGLSLEKMMKLPPGCGVRAKGDSLMVEPLALFSSPAISGEISGIEIGSDCLYVDYTKRAGLPVPHRGDAKNDIFMYGGDVKIGNMLIRDARIQIVDADPKDFFEFHVRRYFKQLSASSISVFPDRSMLVNMPDYSDLAK